MKNEIKIYKEILNGNRKRFPRYFWSDNIEEKSKNIFKYLIEEVLQWDIEKIASDFDDIRPHTRDFSRE